MAKRTGRHPGVWIREDRVPTRKELDWLRTTEGRAICDAMAAGDPADTPTAVARWRRRLEPELVAAAWAQVLLRRAARRKFSRADDMLFDRIGLEQATDEVVATHKARRFAPFARVADLCCGIGGDALALADGREVVALDYSEVRLAMADHNAGVHGRTIHPLAANADFARPEADAVHIDPDRRAEGPRRHALDAASPGPEALRQIVAHYRHAAVKLSPGMDFAALPFSGEIELISHRGECRQAVCWTGGLRRALRSATVLPAGATIHADHEEDMPWPEPRAVAPGMILHEPDAAVIRADLVGVLARRHSLAPLDPRIAYLVGDEAVETPMLTPFRVLDITAFAGRRIRGWLTDHDVGHVEIKTRGFAVSPEELLRRLKLRGRRRAVLFLTRIGGRPRALLAERPGVEA